MSELPVLEKNWQNFYATWLNKLEYMEAWEIASGEFKKVTEPDLLRWTWFFYGIAHILEQSDYWGDDFRGILRLVYPVEESGVTPVFYKEFLQFFRSFHEALEQFSDSDLHYVLCYHQWVIMKYEPEWCSSDVYPYKIAERLDTDRIRVTEESRMKKILVRKTLWKVFCLRLFYEFRDARPHIADQIPIQLG